MNRIATLMVATATVCITACAGAPVQGSADANDAQQVVAPLNNIYDVAWIRSADGSTTSLEYAAGELSQYDVVFFGEYHGHSGNHLAQMRMFQALHERYANMALSLEQFERDTQPVVDQYLAGEIGEQVLQDDARAWDNYEESYRPLVEYAVAHQLPVIAANAPKNAVICVGRKGAEILDEMPQPDRSWVAAELHIEEGAYLDKFMQFVAGNSSHGGGGDASEMSDRMRAMVMQSFAAQVLRDDTMAESITMYLQDHPDSKVLHLNGNFHSASHLGTVERLKVRMPDLKIAVINPIAVDDNNTPAWSDEDRATGDYILLVQNLPDAFVSEEKELEFQREVLGKRMGNKCEYGADAATQD